MAKKTEPLDLTNEIRHEAIVDRLIEVAFFD
jgi:hypothetical protein